MGLAQRGWAYLGQFMLSFVVMLRNSRYTCEQVRGVIQQRWSRTHSMNMLQHSTARDSVLNNSRASKPRRACADAGRSRQSKALRTMWTGSKGRSSAGRLSKPPPAKAPWHPPSATERQSSATDTIARAWLPGFEAQRFRGQGPASCSYLQHECGAKEAVPHAVRLAQDRHEKVRPVKPAVYRNPQQSAPAH